MNIWIPKDFEFITVFSKFSVFKQYIHFLGNSIDISLYLTEKRQKINYNSKSRTSYKGPTNSFLLRQLF